jgi:hypothetical protein
METAKIGSVVSSSWESPGWAALALALVLGAGTLGTGAPWAGFGPSGARAQDASVRDTAAARALFREGVACADAGDWTCAADRFGRAYEIRPSPVVAYNYGHALVEIGRLVEGAEILARVRRDGSAPEAVRADAERVIGQAEPRMGMLSVELDGPGERVVVSIDGHGMAASLVGTAIPVDPGERLVEARRDGETVAREHVTITEGGHARVSLSVPPLPPEEPSLGRAQLDGTSAGPSPQPPGLAGIGAPASAGTDGGDQGPWIALGVTGGVLVVGAAIVLGVLLAPVGEPTPYGGNLGWVEIGR